MKNVVENCRYIANNFTGSLHLQAARMWQNIYKSGGVQNSRSSRSIENPIHVRYLSIFSFFNTISREKVCDFSNLYENSITIAANVKFVK